MLRRLCGPQTVQLRRRSAGFHFRIGEAVAAAQSPWPKANTAIQFDPDHLDRIDILPLAVFASGTYEPNAWEQAWTLAQSDVGDPLFEPVGEDRYAKIGQAAGLIIETRLGADQPLRSEFRIGGRRISADPKWAVKLIERREPPATLGGGSYRGGRRGAPRRAKPRGWLPAGAICVTLIRKRAAA